MGKNKGRSRRRRGTGRPMTVQTPIEEFNTKMEKQNDALTLRGTVFFNFNITTTPSVIANVNPAAFGYRMQNAQLIFSRFRFKELLIEYNVGTPSTAVNGLAALGVLDDAPGATDLPSNLNDVLELRCSNVNYFAETKPSLVRWKPLGSEWGYCYGSTGDQRLAQQGVIYAAATNPAQLVGQIKYVVSFKGAVDTASTVSLPQTATGGEPGYVNIRNCSPSEVHHATNVHAAVIGPSHRTGLPVR